MFYFPTAKALIKIWAQNFKTQIGAIGKRINEPADAVTTVQADLDKMITDISNVEPARLELERLINIMNESIKTVGGKTRDYIKRLKTNPLLTEVDGLLLQIISTTVIADLTSHKPELTGKETGKTLHISFKKHGADGMNIYTRLQGETEWKLLVNAKNSPYIDVRGLLTKGVSEIREFYGMFTLANIEVGQRSEIFMIRFNG